MTRKQTKLSYNDWNILFRLLYEAHREEDDYDKGRELYELALKVCHHERLAIKRGHWGRRDRGNAEEREANILKLEI